jgi:hypothetical protein
MHIIIKRSMKSLKTLKADSYSYCDLEIQLKINRNRLNFYNTIFRDHLHSTLFSSLPKCTIPTPNPKKNTTYSEIYYSLGLKRRPEFYVFVMIIPSFLLTSLCIIGIFMPNSSNGERNEKMTLGLTTLLSMAIILNITAGAMP